jgi:hypothetical protein
VLLQIIFSYELVEFNQRVLFSFSGQIGWLIVDVELQQCCTSTRPVLVTLEIFILMFLLKNTFLIAVSNP